MDGVTQEILQKIASSFDEFLLDTSQNYEMNFSDLAALVIARLVVISGKINGDENLVNLFSRAQNTITSRHLANKTVH